MDTQKLKYFKNSVKPVVTSTPQQEQKTSNPTLNNFSGGSKDTINSNIRGFSQGLDPDLINNLKNAARLDSTDLDSTNLNPKDLGFSEITTPTGPWGMINQVNPKLKIKNFEQGGVTTNNSLNVMAKQQFNKINPNLSNMTPNFQNGGELGQNLKSLVDVAVQIASDFKKQGVITEIAGEQVIAQAFQNTPGADQIFTDAIKKQDMETVIKLFTKLGIVK